MKSLENLIITAGVLITGAVLAGAMYVMAKLLISLFAGV